MGICWKYWMGIGLLTSLACSVAACGDGQPRKEQDPRPPPPRVSDGDASRSSTEPGQPVVPLVHPQWMEQLRSKDQVIRRMGRDALSDVRHPIAEDIRVALIELNRVGETGRLQSAFDSQPELAFLLLANRLGYVSIRMRREVSRALADLVSPPPEAVALLFVHALLDDGHAAEAARAGLASIAPAVAAVLDAADDDEMLHIAGLAQQLGSRPDGARVMGSLRTYLPVFTSRLGSSRHAMGTAVSFMALEIAVKDELTDADERSLLMLWDGLREAGTDRHGVGASSRRWSGGDRTTLAIAVADALRWSDPAHMRRRLADLRTSDRAVRLLVHRKTPLKEVVPEVLDAIVNGITPAATFLAVEHFDLDRPSLARRLEHVVLDASQSSDRRIHAARQLSAFAGLGAAKQVLFDWLKDKSMWRQAWHTLVLCHPDDRAEVRRALADAAGRLPDVRRHDRIMLRRLHWSEERRRTQVPGERGSLAEDLDDWAQASRR